MCLITTSYPCPEPDVDDLLHRLVNTRKVVPCGTLKANGNRTESCAGPIQVQHQHLGQFELCFWCSLTAQLENKDKAEGRPLKRKARSDSVVDDDFQEGEEGWMAKKAKQVDSGGPHEAELVSSASEAMETDGQVLAEPGDEIEQDTSVDMSGDVLALLGAGEVPAVERHFTKGLLFAKMQGPRAAGAIEAAVDRPEEAFGAAEGMQERTDTHDAPTSQGQPSQTSDTAVDEITRARDFASTTGTAEEGRKYPTPPTDLAAGLAKTSKSNSQRQMAPSKVQPSKAPSAQQSEISDLEQVQLLVKKMDQKRVQAEKDREEVVQRNAILVSQNSQQQQEIDRLQTIMTQDSLEHQNENAKEKEAAEKMDAEKASLWSEKQILEEKVRILLQRNDELDKAVSHARQTANATVRGKEDQIAELEREIAIRKQVKEIWQKQCEDARAQTAILQTQITGFRTMDEGMEAENARLKQQLAATEEENAQLQAVTVRAVLHSSPVHKQEPPRKEPAVKLEVEE